MLRGTTKPVLLQLGGEIVPSDVILPGRENQGLSMDSWAEAAAALETAGGWTAERQSRFTSNPSAKQNVVTAGVW